MLPLHPAAPPPSLCLPAVLLPSCCSPSTPLFLFHPAAPFPPRCPPSIPLLCSAAGAEPCPVLAPPPASPPLRSRSRGAPAPPASSPPPLPAPAPAPDPARGPSSPRGTLAASEDATGGKKKKLQRGKFSARGEVGAAGAVPCPGKPRRRRGTGAHLPSAIALFILGVGEGTSGGAKWSGSGTILGKAGQIPVPNFSPSGERRRTGRGGRSRCRRPRSLGE